MIVLKSRNVHEALPEALYLLQRHGFRRSSRYGDVLVIDEPVATVYDKPCERVLLHPWRDANPFFHFYESLWMLAGRNDVAPLARYAKRMATFSDDGKTFNAAYGFRWRHATSWDVDQLVNISNKLIENPDDRRCVLQIWTLKHDLIYTGKDAACNTMATFQIGIDNHLNMSVFCRSNDIIWGCYGANAVHFSMLLEYMARRIGVKVGTYTQISVNWHGYIETAGPMLEQGSIVHNMREPYSQLGLEPYPICDGKVDSTWDEDCANFVSDDGKLPKVFAYKNSFFIEVAWPIVRAHDEWKDKKDYESAMKSLEDCKASDWRLACQEWLTRRKERATASLADPTS